MDTVPAGAAPRVRAHEVVDLVFLEAVLAEERAGLQPQRRPRKRPRQGQGGSDRAVHTQAKGELLKENAASRDRGSGHPARPLRWGPARAASESDQSQGGSFPGGKRTSRACPPSPPAAS